MSQDNITAEITMRLEVVPIPVSDIDRAKAFYVEQVGFNCDHDIQPGNGSRVMQLTPPGSACSIVITRGLSDMEMAVGSQRGLHLVVKNIRVARTLLASRGVAVGEVLDMGGILYVPFADPDGNQWVLQEILPNQ